ncbi:hypothetical protein SAMN05421863_1001191 [Nitrosomonas communis]|uniref:PD(D/E)XK endonuclease domain-containing protein n=2 Tax=Nitrosomonas communis TaxID=44574 RepID=A0A1I4J4W2_9PROT|nr:hypothetical protein SAMN05421863_1001191 [Nitrosomonas communis]
MKLQTVHYAELNARQQESYNFQKVSGVLADYGFTTIRLTDDWQGADFIAQHIDGEQFLKVQLKGRCTLAKKYMNKDLYICFQDRGVWYLAPHDELLAWVQQNMNIINTESWRTAGLYSFPRLSAALKWYLESYRIGAAQPSASADVPSTPSSFQVSG